MVGEERVLGAPVRRYAQGELVVVSQEQWKRCCKCFLTHAELICELAVGLESESREVRSPARAVISAERGHEDVADRTRKQHQELEVFSVADTRVVEYPIAYLESLLHPL